MDSIVCDSNKTLFPKQSCYFLKKLGAYQYFFDAITFICRKIANFALWISLYNLERMTEILNQQQ